MLDMERLIEEFNSQVLHKDDELIILDAGADRLESIAVYIKNHLGFVFLKLVTKSGVPGEGKVWYWFENIESAISLGISVTLENEIRPTLSSIFKNAKHLEQMCFLDSNKTDYLSRSNKLPPLRKSVEANFVDPSVREVLQLASPLSVGGEIKAGVVTTDDTVRFCQVHSGSYNRYIEKQLDGEDFETVANALLKYDGYQGFVWSSLFYQAIENKNKVLLPDKAQAIRMIFLEFARILEHLEFLSSIALEAQAKSFKLTVLKWSLRVEELLRDYSGNMYNIGILTLGGVHKRPPVNWVSNCIQELSKIGDQLKNYVDKISKSSFWRQLDEVAPLSSKVLIDWSIQGPALRASGINFDLRKRRPIYLYDEVEFRTPVGLNGTLYDRFLVRCEEVTQSILIITQLLDNLPTDEIVSKSVPHFSHFGHSVEGEEREYEDAVRNKIKLKDGEYYNSMEAASGCIQIFFTLIEGKVHDLKIGTDYLSKILCLEEASSGVTYESLGLLLRSLHINHTALEK